MRKRRSGKIIMIIIFLIIIAIIATILKINGNKYKVKLNEINESDIMYYVLKQGNSYGVIDKEGNTVIEPQYADIKIPNPTKDVFICTNEVNNENAIWKAVDKDNNRILTEYDQVEAIEINQLTSLVPYEKEVLKYKQGSMYGIIDFSGKKITNAKYEEISNIDYKEGYLKVKKNGAYGVINTKGTQIIKEEYDNITADGYYNDETKYENAGFLLRIKTDEGYRFGYANKKGKTILKPEYNEINRITEIENEKTVYLITSYNGKYGFVKNGKNILNNEFDDIEYEPNSNLLLVTQNVVQGVYKLDGKVVLPIDYNTIVFGGDYINATKDETRLVFDTEGNEIKTDITSHIKASEDYSIIIDSDNSYNIVDNEGNKLLSEKYVYIEYFKDDLFIATQTNKTGLIKANGGIVVPIQYGTLQKINETELLEATELENGKINIINSKGIISEGIENASILRHDNYIEIYSDVDRKYFDLDGNEIEYKNIVTDNKMYAKKNNGKWGIIDSSGRTIVDYAYDMVTEQNGNVAGIKIDGKWGIVDLNGNVIVEPKYDIPWTNAKFLGSYYEVSTNLGVPVYSNDINE